METPEIKIKFVREGAIFERNKPTDAGYDVKVFGREIHQNYIKYYLGIKSEIPAGYYAEVVHRSSNSDKDGILANTKGTIDADFRGEWQARVKIIKQPRLLIQTRNKIPQVIQDLSIDYNYEPLQVWEEGEKALQVIFHKILDVNLSFIPFGDDTELSETERGENGHGSSGK